MTPAKLDPHAARDILVRSYQRSYDRARMVVSPAEVERQVIADCQLVDAARASGELSSSTPRGPAEAPRPRPNRVAEAAAANGTRLDPTGQVIRSRVVHGDPTKISERWGCAAGRIRRILEGVKRDTSSLVVAVENAELGKLATEFAEIWACFTLREQPAPLTGKDRNPFRGMTTRDAARMFQRLVEDLCDRSTGVLGHWYVK